MLNTTVDLTGFGKIPSYFEQIKILELYFKEDFFLNKTQRKIISKNYSKKRMLLMPFFIELLQPKSTFPVRQAVSALWKKYKSTMELDNNIRSLYRNSYRRTTKLVEKFSQLWSSQGEPNSLLIVPFEFFYEEEKPKIIHKKLFNKNMNEFIFGAYETIIAKIIFGNFNFSEKMFPLLCGGDELSNEKSVNVFSSMPCLEYDDLGIQLNTILKNVPYSPAGYFKGCMIENL